MSRPLSDIRADIDALDQQIVTSLFENKESEERSFESPDIQAEEIAQIRALQLRFSIKTWKLLNQRMTLSREVGETKKALWQKVVVDKVRYEEVIKQVQSYAPPETGEKIRTLYNLIHDISVRIQKEIIGTQ